MARFAAIVATLASTASAARMAEPALKKRGEVCETNEQCTADLLCMVGEANYTCRERHSKIAGEPCKAGAECVEGTRCVGNDQGRSCRPGLGGQLHKEVVPVLKRVLGTVSFGCLPAGLHWPPSLLHQGPHRQRKFGQEREQALEWGCLHLLQRQDVPPRKSAEPSRAKVHILRACETRRRLLVRVEQRQPGSGLLQGLLNLGPAENRRWDTGRG
ncbi:unnamed protein product, partial [Symbiodinium natans]